MNLNFKLDSFCQNYRNSFWPNPDRSLSRLLRSLHFEKATPRTDGVSRTDHGRQKMEQSLLAWNYLTCFKNCKLVVQDHNLPSQSTSLRHNTQQSQPHMASRPTPRLHKIGQRSRDCCCIRSSFIHLNCPGHVEGILHHLSTLSVRIKMHDIPCTNAGNQA